MGGLDPRGDLVGFPAMLGQARYPPQRTPEGREAVTALLLRDAGVSADAVPQLVQRILAAVNLSGPHLCTCLHVDGGSDPAHGHGFIPCDQCGGLCVTERWCGHEVMALVWFEAMRQQHHMGSALAKAMNTMQDRLIQDVAALAQRTPPESLFPAIRARIRDWGSFVLHYVAQNCLGNYLYQKEHRTEPGRLYEWDGDEVTRRLSAVKAGAFAHAEAYIEAHPTPLLTDEAVMERAAAVQHTHELAGRLGFDTTAPDLRRTTPTPSALPEAQPPETIETAPVQERVPVARR